MLCSDDVSLDIVMKMYHMCPHDLIFKLTFRFMGSFHRPLKSSFSYIKNVAEKSLDFILIISGEDQLVLTDFITEIVIDT